MGEYCSVRVWHLKTGASTAELEVLAASGIAEMHRWIPGLQQLSLVRLPQGAEARYLMISVFSSYEAYTFWRQVEEEGPDYWERYASVLMHWEQLVRLADEFHGDFIPLQHSPDLEREEPRKSI